MEKKTNSLSIWSFVLSLVGLFVAGLMFGIISVVLGKQAMKEIEQTKEDGYKLAKTGVIIGWIEIACSILFLFL